MFRSRRRLPRLAAAMGLSAGLVLLVLAAIGRGGDPAGALAPDEVAVVPAPAGSEAVGEWLAHDSEQSTPSDEPADEPLDAPPSDTSPSTSDAVPPSDPPVPDVQEPDQDEPIVSNESESEPQDATTRVESCLASAGRLPTSGPPIDSFGMNLATKDGLMVVGDWGAEFHALPTRIFELVDGSWQAVHRIEPGGMGCGYSQLGKAVAVSGTRVAVARTGRNQGFIDEIEIHERAEDGAWQLDTILRSEGPRPTTEDPDPGEGSSLLGPVFDGFAAEIVLDGGALIAADVPRNHQSGLRLSFFAHDAETWKLDASFVSFERSGWVPASIDLREDRLAVGMVAPDRFATEDAGAVVTWRRDAQGGWKEEHRWIQKRAEDAGYFGLAVRWLPDGLAVGSPERNARGAGVVYVFDDDGGDWGVTDVLRAPHGVLGFGMSLALTQGVLAVGAPGTEKGVVLGFLLGEGDPMPCGRWGGGGRRGGIGRTLSADAGWICAGFEAPGPPFDYSSHPGFLSPAIQHPRPLSPDGKPLTPFLLRAQAAGGG